MHPAISFSRSFAMVLLALAACGDGGGGTLDAVLETDPAKAAAPLRVEFSCGEAGKLVVDFDRTAGVATVQPPAGNIMMLPLKSVDGGTFSYESDGYTLSGGGDEVIWQALLAPEIECAATRSSLDPSAKTN